MLVGTRDYQDDKVDIIHKYSADESRSLKSYGELPDSAKVNETAIDLAIGESDDEEEELEVDFENI